VFSLLRRRLGTIRAYFPAARSIRVRRPKLTPTRIDLNALFAGESPTT
jgi:hypothetical protein